MSPRIQVARYRIGLGVLIVLAGVVLLAVGFLLPSSNRDPRAESNNHTPASRPLSSESRRICAAAWGRCRWSAFRRQPRFDLISIRVSCCVKKRRPVPYSGVPKLWVLGIVSCGERVSSSQLFRWLKGTSDRREYFVLRENRGGIRYRFEQGRCS